MKKLLAFLLAALLLVCLAGCRSGFSPAEGGEEPDTPQPPVKEESTDESPLDLQQQNAGLGGEQAEASAADAYEAWAAFVGYWNAADGRFFLLDMEDGHSALYLEAVWETGGGRGYARITELYYENGIFTANILWPETEATEMNDAMPEVSGSVIVDVTDIEQDGTLRLTDPAGRIWQCRYAGATQEEAYNTYLSDQTGS